jgi:hypothetical protein
MSGARDYGLINGGQSGFSATSDINDQFEHVYTTSLRPEDFRMAA